MSKTYLWLHNIEKDFYKLVQLLRETFTTTPAQHVTTSDLQVLWGLKHRPLKKRERTGEEYGFPFV